MAGTLNFCPGTPSPSTMAASYRQFHLLFSIQWIIFLCQISSIHCSSSGASSAAGSGGGVYGGRHSYSLSTFSPSGNIDQVVRAMRASMLGVPIVALSMPPIYDGEESESSMPSNDVKREGLIQSVDAGSTTNKEETTTRKHSLRGGIYLSIPLRFLTTSPFLIDDGTPRVVQLTSSICATHTGVGADGRALCDIAMNIALDYRYVYGEEISVEELLEGLAEKVQEMTMKAGSRPFGCALLIGSLGNSEDGNAFESRPAMYRVDPSGAVVLLSSFDDNNSNPSRKEGEAGQETETKEQSGRRRSVAFLGNWDPLRQKKDGIQNQLENQQFTNEEELQNMLVDVAKQTFMDETSISEESTLLHERTRQNKPVLFASFTREYGLQLSRID